MSAPASSMEPWARLLQGYHDALRWMVRFLGMVSWGGLMFMVAVTTADVVLRAFRLSLAGAYDLVEMAAAVTIAAALPYTTAIKGHVAIEFFFHKLGRRGRVVVDSLMRLVVMVLFSLLAWGGFDYGNSLRLKGEGSMTLQLPVFWVPYVLAASCGLVVLITLYHLVHPGREMIKP